MADPTVANAVIRSSRRAYIIGVKVGQTNIFFFDAEGRQIGGLDIAVTRDLTVFVPQSDALCPMPRSRSRASATVSCSPAMSRARSNRNSLTTWRRAWSGAAADRAAAARAVAARMQVVEPEPELAVAVAVVAQGAVVAVRSSTPSLSTAATR